VTPLDTARSYPRRGRAVVPIPPRRKGPVLQGWQDLRITEADAHLYCDGQAQNIGVLLGALSGGLADVDLDVPSKALGDPDAGSLAAGEHRCQHDALTTLRPRGGRAAHA
jgi:hypothetical protein